MRLLPSNIEVVFNCAKNLQYVIGNGVELQTALMNLVINARDAMGNKGGKLTISARNVQMSGGLSHVNGPHVMISVTDTGTGISPENLQRIFEPFFTTKPVGEGTGLGLAMVFRTIKDHGGLIDVSSKVGQGTSFLIYLPVAAAPAISHPVRVEEVPISARPGEIILFVDDVDTMRRIGQVFLEKLGYGVLLAADAEETLKIYRENAERISLVILDMTIPKMTGRETLKEILKINPSAKVLLASGFTNEGSARELIAAGAKGFMEKPYTLGPLSTLIRKILDKN